MHVHNTKLAFTSPESVFAHPRAVLYSSGLTDDEKIAVLRNWKTALIRPQNAADGRVTARHGPADVDPRPEDVQQAMTAMNRARRA